ncbi:streptococcal hemagglutinin-like isoform X2 [Dermacentor albipictus]|uniref:streptococcal hemagglutinin-like isoform X2 n=1 Tax=Dermacentor albipictus TaxID=60249 RepID=UPI0031FBD8E5
MSHSPQSGKPSEAALSSRAAAPGNGGTRTPHKSASSSPAVTSPRSKANSPSRSSPPGSPSRSVSKAARPAVASPRSKANSPSRSVSKAARPAVTSPRSKANSPSRSVSKAARPAVTSPRSKANSPSRSSPPGSPSRAVGKFNAPSTGASTPAKRPEQPNAQAVAHVLPAASATSLHTATETTAGVETTEGRDTTAPTTGTTVGDSRTAASSGPPLTSASTLAQSVVRRAPERHTGSPGHRSPGHRSPEDRTAEPNVASAGQKSPKQVAAPSPPASWKFPLSPEHVCCLVVVILAAIITVVFAVVYFKSSQNSTAAALRAAPEFAGACADEDAIAGCRNVTLYMLDAMNPDARPCEDFYESVCGWWGAKNPDRRPFLEEHVTTFNHRVAAALANKATAHFENSSGERTESLETQMALFYTGCFMASTGQSETSNAAAVLEAIGIEIRKWDNVSTFAALLDLAVSTTLKSGLPSFVRIDFSANRTLHVDVGQSLASTFSRNSKKTRMFVAGALRDLGEESLPAWINSSTLLTIDHVVDYERSNGNDQTWSALKGPEELKYIAPEIDWRDALERGLPSRFRSEAQREMTVQIRAAGNIRNTVGRLRQQPLRQASLYSLLVLLAQVMKYAPSMEEHASRSVADTSVSSCLRLTAAKFDRFYPLWVARTFQRKDEVAGALAMFKDVTSTLRNDSRVNAGVVIDRSRLTNARLVLYDETGNASLPTVPLVATLGPHFLPNIAAVAAARVGEEETVPEDYWLPQLRGHVGYRADANFLVSSAYLSGSSVFAYFSMDRKTQTMTQYATLGTLILRSIFDSDAGYFPTWARGYINRCFAASASAVLGRPVDQTQAKKFMRTRWSAQLAWLLVTRRLAEEASHEEEAASAASHRVTRDAVDRKFGLDRLFFRLLCFVQCGEPDGREVCNDMARCDRRFAEAFHCDTGSAEWPGSCDCYGMNRCKTHFPVNWDAHPSVV